MQAVSVLRVIGLLGSLSMLGCLGDAPRDNPLDPKSDKFQNTGRLAGSTLSIFAPFRPIADVELRLEPGPFLTRSRSDGSFEFSPIPAGVYTLTAYKAGYAMAPDTVEVTLGRTTTLQLHLNGLPVVERFSVTSCRLRRWFPQTDLLLLELSTQLDDPDGRNDVQLVEVLIPDLGFVDTLHTTQTVGVFEKRIPERRLPGRSLEGMLGHQVFLRVTDSVGGVTLSAPSFLARVMNDVPATISPAPSEVLSEPTPTFSWTSLSLPFDFTYRVEVVRVDEGINTLVWSQTGIARSLTSVAIDAPLPSGRYFWTIAAVDEFGNCSRSKEASFTIL